MEIIDKNLEKLIEAINHVSLNQEDLLSASLEFSKLYFKKNKEAEEEFDKFWNNYFFVEQACISSREAVVLGLHALTLAETVDFATIIDKCMNLENQKENLHQLTKNVKEVEQLRIFFDSLRKELFSRVYSQNKSLQKITEISSVILAQRYELFMNKNFK